MINRLHPAPHAASAEPARLLFQQLRKYAAFYRTLGLPAVRIPLNERERIQVDELTS